MLLNISYPVTGCQQTLKIEEEAKIRAFCDKRISHEVEGDILGNDFKGYILKISGGNDAQGFPMMQGVLAKDRRRLLFTKGDKCYRSRKAGERKKKSVRGCIVAADLSCLNLVVVRKGENEIKGLTDTLVPSRLGPKRANNIRKYFNLSKEDDVKKFVPRRVVYPKGDTTKKGHSKAPKIQRLVTPERVARKRKYQKLLAARGLATKKAAEEFKALLDTRRKEKRAALEKSRAKSRSKSLASKDPKKAAQKAKKAAAKSERAQVYLKEKADQAAKKKARNETKAKKAAAKKAKDSAAKKKSQKK